LTPTTLMYVQNVASLQLPHDVDFELKKERTTCTQFC
jgi:hypothetical protein